ncbi:hypothetical protein DYBT9275_00505 [Dyadobacter sp. CECT 9275]|uniref:Cupin type-2 domain-containing protein n=1 Tax=Dyadobacter helix TaxID=2822344 RepID=A0A916JA81_9BACT|nr:cupin domain-containing protein [Dyadobacter sp. CECT 9275]CAG4990330.1 hypothetical protein DYBT9275_00505 [Dyadobacter sp. CECT 9275]
MKRKIFNPVIRDTTTFLQTAEETNGVFSYIEVTLRPGGQTPLHYHKNFTETFTAEEGELGLHLGAGKKILLSPGETCTVPIGQTHNFFNPGNEEIRFKVLTQPGSAGFENALRILYGLAGDGLTDERAVPKKFVDLAVVAVMSDMHLPGVQGLLYPLMRWIANRARRNGTEQYLLDRYCR